MKKYLIFLIVVLASATFSQTSSTYTRFGIGDIQYSYSPKREAMGKLGVSLTNTDYAGIINPASWMRLTRTRLELSGRYNSVFLSSETESSNFSDGSFGGFTFAFPASTLYGIGVAFGIAPYSDVSYRVSGQSMPEYDISYEGRGGLSKVFIGSSYKLLGVSLGATFDYYFGNMEYISRVDFIANTGANAEIVRKYSPRGVGTTIGIISPDFSPAGGGVISDLRIGGAANIISELNTDTTYFGNVTGTADTLGSGSVKMSIPLRLSGGVSFLLSSKYHFTFDYSYQPWSQYRFNELPAANLRDAQMFSAGVEGRPERDGRESFWEQIVWRAGVSYQITPYEIRGVGINELSFATGVSLPIAFENTLDIGVEYAMRGSKEANLFKENAIKVSFGISLGDYWFVRQEK
jgi:hypothetical protein